MGVKRRVSLGRKVRLNRCAPFHAIPIRRSGLLLDYTESYYLSFNLFHRRVIHLRRAESVPATADEINADSLRTSDQVISAAEINSECVVREQ